jgi:hypothetical protein
MFSSLPQRLPAVASVLSPDNNVGLPGSGALSRSRVAIAPLPRQCAEYQFRDCRRVAQVDQQPV